MTVFKFMHTVEVDGCDEEREYCLPGKNVLCWQCCGNGTRVNPSIDGNGLTRDDFAEDPDFEEDYFAGRYDIVCDVCHGAKVQVEPDLDAIIQGPVPEDMYQEDGAPRPTYAEAWKAYKDYLEDQQFEAQERANDRHVRRQESGGYDY